MFLCIRGSRKKSPFAGQLAAEKAAEKAQEKGVRSIRVKVRYAELSDIHGWLCQLQLQLQQSLTFDYRSHTLL